MAGYDALVQEADELYRRGDWKEASIAYGRALGAGGPRDWHCRHRRGVAARKVAEQRMQKSLDHPEDGRPFLDQAARWLAKAEAYLDSAAEDAPPERQAEIRLEQAEAQEATARFVELCGGDPGRRRSVARDYRREAESLA